MAGKKKRDVSRHERRRMRRSQILFAAIAIIIIASFIVSLITTY